MIFVALMKLLNLTEFNHLGICWANRAIFFLMLTLGYSSSPLLRFARNWKKERKRFSRLKIYLYR